MATIPFGEALGKELRIRRVVLHISQEELARRVGTHQTVVGRYEIGTIPRADRLVALCRALETTPNEVLAFAFDEKTAA